MKKCEQDILWETTASASRSQATEKGKKWAELEGSCWSSQQPCVVGNALLTAEKVALTLIRVALDKDLCLR